MGVKRKDWLERRQAACRERQAIRVFAKDKVKEARGWPQTKTVAIDISESQRAFIEKILNKSNPRRGDRSAGRTN